MLNSGLITGDLTTAGSPRCTKY